MIYTCTGEENIAHMWQDQYNSLLNSVKRIFSKQIMHDKLGTIPNKSKSILFTNSDLSNALKSFKRGKACGVDGLAAKYFYLCSQHYSCICISVIQWFYSARTSTNWFYENHHQKLNWIYQWEKNPAKYRLPWSLPHLNYLKCVYLKFNQFGFNNIIIIIYNICIAPYNTIL